MEKMKSGITGFIPKDADFFQTLESYAQIGYKAFEGFDEKYVMSSGETYSPETVTVHGQGVGHGVGFSATGSEKLARDGYSYKYILSCFFRFFISKI